MKELLITFETLQVLALNDNRGLIVKRFKGYSLSLVLTFSYDFIHDYRARAKTCSVSNVIKIMLFHNNGMLHVNN